MTNQLQVRRGGQSVWLAIALLVVGGASAEPLRPERWTVLRQRDGITVRAGESAAFPLPIFEGSTTIAASTLDVLAALQDVERHSLWMFRVRRTRLIERVSKSEIVSHTRLRAPWPVADRDVVLRTRVSSERDGGSISARFRAVSYRGVPASDDAVRIERMEGFYQLDTVRPGQTRVIFRLAVDPAGAVPRWLVGHALRELPYRTLRDLRSHIERMRSPR